jgi:hypothetical protein
MSLERWLETAGPRCICEWLAASAEDLATKDVASWSHWAEVSDLFRGFARALPDDQTNIVDLGERLEP